MARFERPRREPTPRKCGEQIHDARRGDVPCHASEVLPAPRRLVPGERQANERNSRNSGVSLADHEHAVVSRAAPERAGAAE